jgi:hypothetical protein
VLCGLAALAAVAGAPPDARAAILPTVRCAVSAGIGGQRYPAWPTRQQTVVPASLAATLAVYVGGFQRVVAPRGWRCGVLEAANGGNVITVSKPGAGPAIKSWSEPACAGCIYDAVCRYFPREAAPLSVGLPCSAAVPGERVTRLSRTLVRVRSSRGAAVGLVFFESREERQRAAGVSCLQERICNAVLADWRAQLH